VDKWSLSLDLDERVLDNPWNRNSNAYISALYTGKMSLSEARYPNPFPSDLGSNLNLENKNRGTEDEKIPVPGIFLMQLGDHDVINLFPSANAHPTADKLKPPRFEYTSLSPERYTELENTYKRSAQHDIAERRDYDRNVTEQLERLSERYSSVQEQEEECRESLADEGLYEGNLVSGTAIIAWYAISQYTVTSSPGNLTATTAGTSATVTGLTNGTSYTFTVTATNSAGTGSASGASDSTSVPPPLGFSVEASSASVGSGTNAVTAGVISGGVGTFTGQVNWGDGTTESATITGNSVVGGKHTYASAGTYTATITITDSASQQVSDSIVFTVTTDNATVTIPSVGPTGMEIIVFSILALSVWMIYRRNRLNNKV
jgi:hypothetical protein